jgi:hypothetical protein
MKICSIPNCNSPVWGKGLCRFHIPKKKLTVKKYSSKEEDIQLMRDFFLSIWRKRPHFSEISNTALGNEPLSTFFHHIILKQVGKRKCPYSIFDSDNIILLTEIEHTQVHIDMYRYEEINRRRKLLEEKYGI